jgi:hypothetical protein
MLALLGFFLGFGISLLGFMSLGWSSQMGILGELLVYGSILGFGIYVMVGSLDNSVRRE